MPYEISEESIQILHKHVFPYWAKRNIHELWRSETNSGLPVQIHDRFFSVYYWKTISMSEVPPGHETLVALGTTGMIRKIEEELAGDAHADEEKKNTLRAMMISLEAVNAYARNLARQALEESRTEKNQRRKAELEKMHQILLNVPENPPPRWMKPFRISFSCTFVWAWKAPMTVPCTAGWIRYSSLISNPI